MATVAQLARLVGGELRGPGDVVITAALPLDQAGPGHITFLESPESAGGERHPVASSPRPSPAAILVGRAWMSGAQDLSAAVILVDDPLAAFVTVVCHLRGIAPDTPVPHMVHWGNAAPVGSARRPETAARNGKPPCGHVSPTAVLGEGTCVFPGAWIGDGAIVGKRGAICPGVVVGPGCRLGDDVVLHPNVVLYPGTVLGDRVVVHAGAVIGADGFGYRFLKGRHEKVPQLGHVEIGPDVEIGANTTIDRGTFGATVIGEGTKIDNLVMIGHNCKIGRHNVIVSQVGIAGSVTTGDYVTMAGQTGVRDHVTIGEGAMLGARAGVMGDVPPGGRYVGTPATPEKDQKRLVISLSRVPELRAQVARLEAELSEMREKLAAIINSPKDLAPKQASEAA